MINMSLHTLDDLEITNTLYIGMHTACIPLADFLGNHDALFEKIFIDLVPDLLFHKHDCQLFLSADFAIRKPHINMDLTEQITE